MKTLIISDDYNKSFFLKKGFQLENLIADTSFSYHDIDLGELVAHYRFIILLSDNLSQLRDWYDLCILNKSLIKLIVLCSELNSGIITFSRQYNIPVYTRPFPVRLIANEIKKCIYDFNESYNNVYVIRDLELNVSLHQLKKNNEVIYLRNKEFNLLHFLILNRGKIISRNMLLEYIWDRNANLLTNTVEVHISNLRKKIEKNKESKYIYTYPCTGYMLN